MPSPGKTAIQTSTAENVPRWRAKRGALHHVIVGWDTYDERVLRGWLEARIHAVEAATWDGIVGQLRFLAILGL